MQVITCYSKDLLQAMTCLIRSSPSHGYRYVPESAVITRDTVMTEAAVDITAPVEVSASSSL
jgi:hypothetical protein